MKETDKEKLWKFDLYEYIGFLDSNEQEILAVSIIQWIPTSNGKGIKKSKQIKWFIGRLVDFNKIVATAQKFIDRMNKMNKKSITEPSLNYKSFIKVVL